MTTKQPDMAAWVRNDHYHCPKCHSLILCIGVLRFGDAERIGQCQCCGLLMIENRYANPFFSDRPNKYPNEQWRESVIP